MASHSAIRARGAPAASGAPPMRTRRGVRGAILISCNQARLSRDDSPVTRPVRGVLAAPSRLRAQRHALRHAGRSGHPDHGLFQRLSTLLLLVSQPGKPALPAGAYLLRGTLPAM